MIPTRVGCWRVLSTDEEMTTVVLATAFLFVNGRGEFECETGCALVLRMTSSWRRLEACFYLCQL